MSKYNFQIRKRCRLKKLRLYSKKRKWFYFDLINKIEKNTELKRDEIERVVKAFKDTCELFEKKPSRGNTPKVNSISRFNLILYNLTKRIGNQIKILSQKRLTSLLNLYSNVKANLKVTRGNYIRDRLKFST